MKTYVLYTLIALLGTTNIAEAGQRFLPKVQQLYKTFQYEKAILQIEQALRTPKSHTKKVRVQGQLYLSMCQFQRGNPLQSLPPMRAAWALDPKPTLPKDASPAYKKWYQKARVSWQNKHKSRALPPKRATPQARVTPKRILPRARPRPVKRIQAKVVKRGLPATPKPKARSIWARHGTSIIIMSIGVATLAAGIGVGVLYQGHQTNFQTLSNATPTENGKTIQVAHAAAFTSGFTATILLSAGGLITGVGAGVLIYELTRASK